MSCVCGKCETCRHRVYMREYRDPDPDHGNRGNEKWKSEQRMPWPKEYFELDPRSGCPLSSPTEASIIPARRHLDAE